MTKVFLLQEEGYDTVDANRALGYPDDCREYTSVHNILKELSVKSIRLMVRLPQLLQRYSKPTSLVPVACTPFRFTGQSRELLRAC